MLIYLRHSTNFRYCISDFLPAVRCNHHCENSRDMERGLGIGLPVRDSTPPVMDNILHEVSSIRQFLEKREASRDIAKEWLQVGYVLDVLLFRVYLLAMLAYSITLGTLWSVWQYAWRHCVPCVDITCLVKINIQVTQLVSHHRIDRLWVKWIFEQLVRVQKCPPQSFYPI